MLKEAFANLQASDSAVNRSSVTSTSIRILPVGNGFSPRNSSGVRPSLTESLNEQPQQEVCPAHLLIKIVNQMPDELLAEVSPESKSLKMVLKRTLLILLANAGVQSSIAVVFMKMFGELIQSGDYKNYVFMFILLFVALGVASLSNVHSMNLAMKYFDQMQVIPIFMSCIMINWILSGMLILQEFEFYTWAQLVSMLVGFALCCVGIKILMSKVSRRHL